MRKGSDIVQEECHNLDTPTEQVKLALHNLQMFLDKQWEYTFQICSY